MYQRISFAPVGAVLQTAIKSVFLCQEGGQTGRDIRAVIFRNEKDSGDHWLLACVLRRRDIDYHR